MANVPPATVTVTSSTGAGQAVTALQFTDVTDLEVDFKANTIKITHGIGITYFDFSVIATVTWTVSGGASTIAFS